MSNLNPSIEIPLTIITDTTIPPAYEAPPAYSVSPTAADPKLLAQALRDHQENNNPSRWGTRCPASRSGNNDPELTGLVGWLIWMMDLMATPQGVMNLAGPGAGGYWPMGHGGIL